MLPLPVFNAVIHTTTIFQEEGFLLANNCTQETAVEVLTDYFMKRFLEGQSMAFDTEDDVEREMRQIIANDVLKRLKSRGVVDCIEDEHGEMVHFLTSKGKIETAEFSTNS